MSLNETPVSERVQIGFLGNVNAGKSPSLMPLPDRTFPWCLSLRAQLQTR